MKKLALLLALCLLLEGIGVTAFASEEPAEVPEAAAAEETVTTEEEVPAEAPAQEAEPVQEEEPKEEPVTEEPATEAPAAEEPAAEAPAAEEPAAEAPAAEAPAAEEPAQEAPAAEAPAAEAPAAEEPAQEAPAAEAPAEEAPAQEEEPEEDPHFSEGYILIKKGNKVYAFANATKILGTIDEDAYAYAKIEKEAKNPADDWLQIVFDTEAGEEIKAFVRMKSIETLTDKEQAALQAKLVKAEARQLNGKPVPTAKYTAYETKAPEAAEAPAAEPAPAEEPPAEEPAAEAQEELLEEKGDKPNFVLDANDCICEYNGTMTGVTLPQTINGKTVQGITQKAFSNNSNIVSVVFPANGYTLIDDGVFENCTALKSVTFYNPIVTIVAKSFKGCTSLEAVSYPQSLQVIGQEAFSGCTSLKAVAMTTSLTTIGKSAFLNCTSLQDFDMEEATSLTTIGSEALKGCTSLKEIIIPDSALNIEHSAFEGCSAASRFKLPAALVRIENNTFKNCSSIPYVILPNTVDFIGQEAFAGCTGLDYFVMSTGIKNILKGAFAGIGATTVVYFNGINGFQMTEGAFDTGIMCGDINGTIHNYVKNHSSLKFVSTEGRAYVDRAFTQLLVRGANWAERTARVRMLGTDKGGADVVKSVVDLQECKDKKWTPSQLLDKLYWTMHNRTYIGDPEAQIWLNYLTVRMSTDYVINGIAKSDEHVANCEAWLMRPGKLKSSAYRDKKYKVTLFVFNAITQGYYGGNTTLATEAQVESGCKHLLKDKWTGYKWLHHLVKNKLFKKRKLNNTQFVNTLYLMYLGRNATAAELNKYVPKLNSKKKTKTWVEQSIAKSKAFKKAMKKLKLKNY